MEKFEAISRIYTKQEGELIKLDKCYEAGAQSVLREIAIKLFDRTDTEEIEEGEYKQYDEEYTHIFNKLRERIDDETVDLLFELDAIATVRQGSNEEACYMLGFLKGYYFAKGGK